MTPIVSTPTRIPPSAANLSMAKTTSDNRTVVSPTAMIPPGISTPSTSCHCSTSLSPAWIPLHWIYCHNGRDVMPNIPPTPTPSYARSSYIPLTSSSRIPYYHYCPTTVNVTLLSTLAPIRLSRFSCCSLSLTTKEQLLKSRHIPLTLTSTGINQFPFLHHFCHSSVYLLSIRLLPSSASPCYLP